MSIFSHINKIYYHIFKNKNKRHKYKRNNSIIVRSIEPLIKKTKKKTAKKKKEANLKRV